VANEQDKAQNLKSMALMGLLNCSLKKLDLVV